MRTFPFDVLNRPVDVSEAFNALENTVFVAERAAHFDARSGEGTILWRRYQRKPRLAFGEVTLPYEEGRPWEFPGSAYTAEPELPFRLTFPGPRTVRLQVAAQRQLREEQPSLMLASEPVPDGSWRLIASDEHGATYQSAAGRVRLSFDPWRIELHDARGRCVLRSYHFSDCRSLLNSDQTPLAFVRRTADMRVHTAAGFTLSPNEKIYGCGESFTRLNKRGQKLVIMTNDPHGAQTKEMYKPIPFFLSSEGYGIFAHTSAPLTFDFGHAYDGGSVIFSGDDHLDLFIFLGEPREVLEAYTALTGRSPVPPLWSFGLWMSRITYTSEREVRDVARKLREHRIPADVIHLDTGWFERDWCCDYTFSKSRFPDPEAMLADLRRQGFRVSAWQLPYFTPDNPLYRECVEKGYAVKGPGGGVATEDAVIDFSNPEAVRWYQGLLKKVLLQGVSAIKVDFGEAAPFHGLYASGRTGFYEHNLYPLRYNQAAFEITREITGDSIIWARSAWAGSQRYPLHWSGDAETTYSSMAATLRGGLSFGLCGFTFWSHDVGGFTARAPEDLYARWLAFGVFSSHTRLHGVPPKEPWEYSDAFLDVFRKTVEMRYRLMPYIYAQAAASAERGHPLVRPLFFEFPDDPASWLIEDAYMFGSDMLVAPLFDDATARLVYLPPGGWIDYQTGRRYQGGTWHTIEAGEVPAVVLVRDGAAVPHIEPAQHTGAMDWRRIELRAFCAGARGAAGLVALPPEARAALGLAGPPGVVEVRELALRPADGGLRLESDPFGGAVEWRVTAAPVGE